MRKKGRSMLETVEKVSIDSSLEILGRKITFNKRRDYLILGVVLIIFAGAFYSWYLDNQPYIALDERKSITVGDNICRFPHVRFEGIISNNTDTFLVFSDVTDVTEYQTYMYFGLNTIRKHGSFSINGMEFSVISVDIPKNVTVIERIK
jgi:hypothetical protein